MERSIDENAAFTREHTPIHAVLSNTVLPTVICLVLFELHIYLK